MATLITDEQVKDKIRQIECDRWWNPEISGFPYFVRILIIAGLFWSIATLLENC